MLERQHNAFTERDAGVGRRLLEDTVLERPLGDLVAASMSCSSPSPAGLDDRHDAFVLAGRRIACRRIALFGVDALVAWDAGSDVDHGAPLGGRPGRDHSTKRSRKTSTFGPDFAQAEWAEAKCPCRP